MFNTPSFLEGVLFEGTTVGRILSMKFEEWDLVDSEKFPHLETSELMQLSIEGAVTTLKPRTCLRGVEEARLLHLLLIPHFHWAPITIFVIRQLLLLVHDGYLWLDEPIPITTEPIHWISQLPYVGRDLAEIVGTSGDLKLMEAM